MWPAAFWEKLYEPLIRRAAGLGRAARQPIPTTTRRRYAHLRRAGDRRRPGRPGGGARGRAGRRARHPGRRGFRARRPAAAETAATIDGMPGADWAAQVGGRTGRPCRTSACMPRTTVFGVYDDGTYGAVERVTDHLPRAARAPAAPAAVAHRARKRAVLAAGAIERPLVFGGNDRPGVMLASAVRTYVNRFAAAPGQRRRGLHQQRRRLARRSTRPARPASTVAAVVDAAPRRRRGSVARWPAGRARHLVRGGVVDARRRRRRCARSRSSTPAGARATLAGRRAGGVGRLEPDRRT